MRLGGAALGFVLLLFAGSAAALEIRVAPPSPHQGDIATIFVGGAGGARQVDGTLGGRPLYFFRYGESYAALAGIDLDTKPGKLRWRIDVVDALGALRSTAGSIVVSRRTFSVQRLTLPKAMVDLAPEDERRADSEAARLELLFRTVTPERLWHGRFARPVGGDEPGEGFGSRRIINGEPRMPHSGVDFPAERGALVVASNRGRVVLVAHFFFAGRLVVLDHGLGLYTLYFHLDHAKVAEGTLVERGEPIGVVGATGRATGPHLHWSVELGSSRVDPLDLLSVAAGD